MKKSRKILIGLLSLGLVTGLWSFSNDDRYFEMAKNLDIFSALYTEVNTYYVDEINPNDLIETGIKSMLKKLDPYTVYIPEDDIEDYRTNATGQYGGIGILSNNINGKHLVLDLYKDSPAFEGGVKIGDQLISINGISIIDMRDDEIGKLIKGQSGSQVNIQIRRNEKELIDFNLDRQKIRIPTISYSTVLFDSIGYLKLTEFTRNAGQDMQNTIIELKSLGAQYLIIDLRGNPGGLLNEAVNICNLFIPKGTLVVETKGKTKAQSFTYPTKNPAYDTEIPVAVLINENSASASEIVSGVLQDYDRGVIIGAKSYGKGLVQATRPLSYNSQLKVTTAKYYIPSGRCIQALDYQHKNADGTATLIPDSLKKEFYTSNGRIVYDGGGVDPDLKIDKEKHSTYSSNLRNSGLIFEYATKYYYGHESVADASSFTISDTEYNQFSKWVSAQNFENTSQIEKALDFLKDAAQEDKTYHTVVKEISLVSQAVDDAKSNGINNFKSEIKKLLEQEIIKRYYGNEGLLSSTLSKDSSVLVAKTQLFDQSKYQQTLSK
ncbi:MAG: S41 family peptidase [Reichenbachiella sp.]